MSGQPRPRLKRSKKEGLLKQSQGKPTEESIGQCNSVDFCHCRVVDEIRVNEKENRHIHRLSSVESLLLKAEALDFAKVRGDLRRRDAVRSNTNNILAALICRRIEGKCSFSRQNTDLSLLRGELPRHDVGH